LRRYRVVQLKERIKTGDLWKDYDLVFTTGVGTPISRVDLITRPFGEPAHPTYVFTTCGIPDATLLLGKGVHVKLVQELLGHSTIAITLDTYSHVLPGMGASLADTMDEAFG
jgi:integrase